MGVLQKSIDELKKLVNPTDEDLNKSVNEEVVEAEAEVKAEADVEEAVEEETEKGLDVQALNDQIQVVVSEKVEEIMKSYSDKTENMLGDLSKSIGEMNQITLNALIKSLQAVNSENENLKKGLNDLSTKVAKMEKTPNLKKSATTVERFGKDADTKSLSKSEVVGRLTGALLDSKMSDFDRTAIGNDIMKFEVTGNVNDLSQVSQKLLS